MKLRNKKTGNIYTLSENLYIEYTQGGKIEVRAIIPGGNMSYYYDSLDKLNEDWEDYKPTEPYIRNERIRKFVRDWAMFNQINTAHVERVNSEVAWFLFVGKDSKYCRWEMAVHADFFETFGENYENIERPINDFCGEEG